MVNFNARVLTFYKSLMVQYYLALKYGLYLRSSSAGAILQKISRFGHNKFNIQKGLGIGKSIKTYLP